MNLISDITLRRISGCCRFWKLVWITFNTCENKFSTAKSSTFHFTGKRQESVW